MRLILHRFPAVRGLPLLTWLGAAMAGIKYSRSDAAILIVTNTNDSSLRPPAVPHRCLVDMAAPEVKWTRAAIVSSLERIG